VTLNVNKLRK